MDPETISEVIAAFSALGAEAKDAFIWYLVLVYFTKFLINLAWVCLVGFAAVKIVGLIRYAINVCDVSTKLSRAFNNCDDWSRAQLAAAEKVLREHPYGR
jgi:hypothetical protein